MSSSTSDGGGRDRKSPDPEVEARDDSERLTYSLTQIPPVPILISVALQHSLTTLAPCLAVSLIVADQLCVEGDDPIRTQLFSSTMFMAGVGTILQTLVGLRLPVFQGPSASFIPALLAVQQSAEWTCADSSSAGTQLLSDNGTLLVSSNTTGGIYHVTGSEKLQQMSGSLMAASLVEIVIGGTGLVGTILRYIGPVTVAPTITLIGLSIYKVPLMYSRPSWEIAFSCAILILVFNLYLRSVDVPLPKCGRGKKGKPRSTFRLFQLLPILLGIVIMWIVCAILTVTDVIPNQRTHYRYTARTDAKASLIADTPWFMMPYPGQFGMPRFSLSLFIGFSVAFCASMVESIGDYFAASRACEVDTPPKHAVNRGILIEGLAGLLSGAVGTGHATTSFSGSIAALTVTKTASRSVMACAGLMMIICSVIGKFGAIFATIPDPILGGVLTVICGMLTSLGVSVLRYVNLASSRNLSILGVSLFVGIFIPEWISRYPDFINTGNVDADGVLKVALGTPMFLGGVIAVILDNTVKGTLEERGMIAWRGSHESGGSEPEDPDRKHVTTSEAYSWDCMHALYKRLPFASKPAFMPPLEDKYRANGYVLRNREPERLECV